MGEGDLKEICNDLKQKLDRGIDLNGKSFKNNQNYSLLVGTGGKKQDWCNDVEDTNALCKKLMVGMDLVLNPDGHVGSSAGYPSALDGNLCDSSKEVINESWLDIFGEWIGHGITASNNINKEAKDSKNELTQAQQSGLYLLNRH